MAPAATSKLPTPDSLRLDAQFCFPIYAANNLIHRAYRPLLEPLGLTYPQYLVMMVLWEQAADTAVDADAGTTVAITVSALGTRLLLDSGTLSPLLKRLEARKLIKKRGDRADGRRVVVTLTAKGRALREDAARVPEALVCRILQGSSVDAAALAQLEQTRQQLRALVAGLDAAIRVEGSPSAAPPAFPSPAARREASASTQDPHRAAVGAEEQP